MTLLLVLIGGAVGAPTRFLTDQWVTARLEEPHPYGTFAVNIAGSLVLGLLAGASDAGNLPAWVWSLVGIGFCGALTTFSTFAWETVRLVELGLWRPAIVNVSASLAIGLGAAALGWAITS